MNYSSGMFPNFRDCNDLPNPFTPLAFLPPNLAFQTQFAGFVAASSLAILIWDQLHALSEDYKLAFKNRVCWPTIAYFISRIFTLVFLIGENVQQNSPTDHCKLFTQLLGTCFLIAHASTALLMYFRVCTVYGMKKAVVLFFGFTWLAVVAGAATPLGARVGVPDEHTRSCNWVIKHRYVIALPIIDLINDTLILLAIMYKLGMADIRRNTSQISGAWKPTGYSQMYYAIAVVLNLSTVITVFAIKSSPQSPFPFLMIPPNMVIVHIMACRVFKNVQLDHHSQTLVVPFQVNAANLEDHKHKPSLGDESPHDGGDTNVSKSAGFSSQTELPVSSIVYPHELGIEKPSAHLGGTEVTKVIELTPGCP